MHISNGRIVVERIEDEKKEGGFEMVNAQDSYVYRGRVTLLPELPYVIGNKQIVIGDIVLFAKYSPDTQEIEHEGKKIKFVKVEDVMAVL